MLAYIFLLLLVNFWRSVAGASKSNVDKIHRFANLTSKPIDLCITRIYKFIYHALTFVVDAHSNLLHKCIYITRGFKFKLCATRAYRGSRNSNFEADVLKTHSHWVLLL